MGHNNKKTFMGHNNKKTLMGHNSMKTLMGHNLSGKLLFSVRPPSVFFTNQLFLKNLIKIYDYETW